MATRLLLERVKSNIVYLVNGKGKMKMQKQRALALLILGGAWIGCSTESVDSESMDIDERSAALDSVPPSVAPGSGGIRPAARAVARRYEGGGVLALRVPSFARASDLDVTSLLAMAQARVPALQNLQLTDFEVVSRIEASPGNGNLAHVTLRQVQGAVPMEGTHVRFSVKPGVGTATSTLASVDYRVFEHATVDPVPTISAAAAQVLAVPRLRAPQRAPIIRRNLELASIDGQLQLVWRIAARGSYYEATVIANGERAGQIILKDARIFADGVVTGHSVEDGAPGGIGTVVSTPLVNLQVSSNSLQTLTGPSGEFALDIPDGTAVLGRLLGRAVSVANATGPEIFTLQQGSASMELELAAENAIPRHLAQVTAYRFTDAIRTFLENNGFPNEVLGAALPANVNVLGTCNAFYDPFEVSTNYFSAGGGCNNAAIDSVIAHEYGHFADDMAGGIFDGGLSEGWGDLLACYLLNDPAVGTDLFVGEPLRSCDNDYIFQEFDEVHALGQSWAGFGWDARVGLQASLGEAEGDALARALVIPSLISNAPDIPAAVREVFVRDDDDGDLLNETPHWDILFQAAQNHGLEFAVEPDFVAPNAVTDLRVQAVAGTTVRVAWTAPGDDADVGRAAAYEIRASQSPITAENFEQATLVDPPSPAFAGTSQSVGVAAPPNTTVFVALVTRDESGNVSPLSNVVEATTTAGIEIFQDGVEDDVSDWTTEGLWHVTGRRATEGASSWWYGLEATGNYDTGSANAGVLRSPIISLAGALNPVLVFDELLDVELGDAVDLVETRVTNVDDPTQTVSLPKIVTGPTFSTRVLGLGGFAGANVQISFHFDTVDASVNTFEGWYLDNLRIIGSENISTCDHGLCEFGEPLVPGCSSCVDTVCSVDPFCCDGFWDDFCIEEAVQLCAVSCETCGDDVCGPTDTCETCEGDCGSCQGGCEHELCDTGEPLFVTCDPCVTDVCAADPFCCDTEWDRLCVVEAAEVCGLDCRGCDHEVCEEGVALDAACDPCATSVCEFDPFCCEVEWDDRCVSETSQVCEAQCESCAHPVCEAGGPLESSCSNCTALVCEFDPFCCASSWDSRCVAQAEDLCACNEDAGGDTGEFPESTTTFEPGGSTTEAPPSEEETGFGGREPVTGGGESFDEGEPSRPSGLVP